MLPGTLSALHSTQEGWEGGTAARDLYPGKQERPVSELGHGHLVDRGQAGPWAGSEARLLTLTSWLEGLGQVTSPDSLRFLISEMGGRVSRAPWPCVHVLKVRVSNPTFL